MTAAIQKTVTNVTRSLERIPAGFNSGDFDMSRDGREIVVERLQQDSDVVLLDR